MLPGHNFWLLPEGNPDSPRLESAGPGEVLARGGYPGVLQAVCTSGIGAVVQDAVRGGPKTGADCGRARTPAGPRGGVHCTINRLEGPAPAVYQTLFYRGKGQEYLAMLHGDLVHAAKMMATCGGVDPARVSGEQLPPRKRVLRVPRRVAEGLIQHQGDWQSMAYREYLTLAGSGAGGDAGDVPPDAATGGAKETRRDRSPGRACAHEQCGGRPLRHG